MAANYPFLDLCVSGELRTALWLSFLKEVTIVFKLGYSEDKYMPSKCSKLLLPTSYGAT